MRLTVHDGLDVLVAAAQVAGGVGIVHVIVVGDATGKGRQHLGRQSVKAEFGGYLLQATSRVVVDLER